jgi:hypothetical protein
MPSYNLTKKNILLTIIRQNSQQTRNVVERLILNVNNRTLQKRLKNIKI